MFILLGFASYVNFCTYIYVVDSCTTTGDENVPSKMRWINFLFRFFNHMGALSLVLIAIFAPTNCKTTLYPWPFLYLIYMVVINHAYRLWMRYCVDYLIDMEYMKKNIPMSADRLRFNNGLFERQTSQLNRINVIFSFCGILIFFGSYMFIEDPTVGGQNILCLNGNEWAPLDIVGTIFVLSHQLLIMLQIKLCQSVIVDIPMEFEIFEVKSL